MSVMNRTRRLVLWFAAGLAIATPTTNAEAEDSPASRSLVRASPPAKLFFAWREGDRKVG